MPDYGPFSDLVPGDTAVQDAPKNYGVFSDLVPKQSVSAFAPPSSEQKKDYGPFTDLVPASVTPAADKALAATSGKPFVQAENSIARAASQGRVPSYDPSTGGDDLNNPIVPAGIMEPVLRGSAAAMTGGLSEVALANVPGAKGVLKGASELYSGATTPQNAAMLAIAPEGKLAQGLIGGIFLGQQLWADPEQWKALQAAKTLDEQVAIGTQMLGGHVLPALAIVHASLSKGAPKPEPATLSRPAEQNAVQTATEPAKGEPNAIQNQETAAIHGDVLNPQRESQIAGAVPATQGSQGISDTGLADQEQRIPITTEEAIAEINRRNAPNDSFAQYRPTESGVINEETPKIDVTQTQERGIQGREVNPETQAVDLTDQPVTGNAVEPVIGDSPTTGIAQRVHEKRATEGRQGPIMPGEGVSAQDMVIRGRELVQSGANPDALLNHMKTSGQISGDNIAILRAKHEELGRITNRAEDAMIANPDSPQAMENYNQAWTNETKWAQEIKPFQTEWHKIGQAMQGETAIDTGTFTGLRRAVRDIQGRDIKPEEAGQLTKMATKVRRVSSEVDVAVGRYEEIVKRETAGRTSQSVEQLREHFSKRLRELTPC